MEVKVWIGEACPRSEMTGTSALAMPAGSFAAQLGDSFVDLDDNGALFIVGGRKSIIRALKYDLGTMSVYHDNENLVVAIKTSQKFIGKNKRIIQVHGHRHGPGVERIDYYARDANGQLLSMAELREALQTIWGSRFG